MEIIFELFIRFVVEFFLQAVFELFIDIGIHKAWDRRQRKTPIHFVLVAFWYASLAAGTAYISVMIFPAHFIEDVNFRLFNLVLAPVLAGAMMSLRGKLLVKKGKVALRLDTFAYGYLFALVFAATRFWLCK